MESNRRININTISIILIIGILLIAGIVQSVQAREGYIMNLLLSAMHDVFIDTPSNGQVLTYNGSHWINEDIADNSKWQLLCQNTLTSDATSISCDNFTAKRIMHYSTFIKTTTTGTAIEIGIRFNSNNSISYDVRYSLNGNADVTYISKTYCGLLGLNAISGGNGGIVVGDIHNTATDRKLINAQATFGTSFPTGTAPSKFETACKWDNTNQQITSMAIIIGNAGTAQYATGSQISIWGYD